LEAAQRGRQSSLLLNRHCFQRTSETRATIAEYFVAVTVPGEHPAQLCMAATKGKFERLANGCVTLSRSGVSFDDLMIK